MHTRVSHPWTHALSTFIASTHAPSSHETHSQGNSSKCTYSIRSTSQGTFSHWVFPLGQIRCSLAPQLFPLLFSSSSIIKTTWRTFSQITQARHQASSTGTSNANTRRQNRALHKKPIPKSYKLHKLLTMSCSPPTSQHFPPYIPSSSQYCYTWMHHCQCPGMDTE